MTVTQQEPVVFQNRNGLRLVGILHTPARSRSDGLAVILLSPGVKMRVGPHGLYRRLTERFVSLGFPVLRFDFYGLGDSEGALPEQQLRDVYNHIEVGRFVNDTIDAMNWMQQRCGTTGFVLSGLCGGAITGLLAGGLDSRVAGLLGLGITPVLASRAAEASHYMTAGQLEKTRQKYIRRLLKPQAWLRLLSFRSDYRLIVKFLMQPLRKRLQPAVPAEAPPPEQDNANPLFPPAFFKMLTTRRPMLLIFGGSDRLRWEFDEKFVARHRAKLDTSPGGYEVHIVKDANHVLSLREWQDDMLACSTRWVTEHFATGFHVAQSVAVGEALVESR